MTTTGAITIYHYDEEHELWQRTAFHEAHLCYNRKAVEDKGFKRQNTGIIRIPVSVDININIGDRIFENEMDSDKPPSEGAMTVVGYKDNRRGTNPHWRIDVI